MDQSQPDLLENPKISVAEKISNEFTPLQLSALIKVVRTLDTLKCNYIIQTQAGNKFGFLPGEEVPKSKPRRPKKGDLKNYVRSLFNNTLPEPGKEQTIEVKHEFFTVSDVAQTLWRWSSDEIGPGSMKTRVINETSFKYYRCF